MEDENSFLLLFKQTVVTAFTLINISLISFIHDLSSRMNIKVEKLEWGLKYHCHRKIVFPIFILFINTFEM